jgi:hypothetical protein
VSPEAATPPGGPPPKPEPAEPDDLEDEDDEDPDEAPTELVEPVEPTRGPADGLDEDDEEDYGPIEPAPPPTEVEETTLIPKVTDTRPAESTTVMPPVSAPTSGMAHRPYTAAPSGYGRPARRAPAGAPRWRPPQPDRDPGRRPAGRPADRGAAGCPGEDPYPTQVQPAVLAPGDGPQRARLPAAGVPQGGHDPLPAAAAAELPPRPARARRRGRRRGRAQVRPPGGADRRRRGGGRGRRARRRPAWSSCPAPRRRSRRSASPRPPTPAPPTPPRPARRSSGLAERRPAGRGEHHRQPDRGAGRAQWYKENLGVVGLTVNPTRPTASAG